MPTALLAIPIGIVLVLLLTFALWKTVAQDEAAVVTGLKKRVISGGGGFVIPGLERMDKISLGNIPLHVETRGGLSSQGVPISVCTTAVIKVHNTHESILTAIEQFTGRNQKDIIENIMKIATDVLEGKLREIIATMTVEDLYGKREEFSDKVQSVVGSELAKMGLAVMNFTITDISDANGYIKALGDGQIAQRKKDAEIEKAVAKQEQDVKTAEANKIGETAQIAASVEIAEAEKNKRLREAEFAEEQAKAQAKAELAHDIQTSITQKDVINATMDAKLLEQLRQKEISEAEIQVEITKTIKNAELAEKKAIEKERQLLADVVKPAEADKLRLQQVAEAEKYQSIKMAEADAEKLVIDAKAEAEALTAKAQAESDAIIKKAKAEAEAARLVGEAEAQAIQAKLLAEAEGLSKKADALAKMDKAGITQMVIEKLPEIASAVAEPLTCIEKITIVDSGEGNTGVGQVAGYVPAALTKVIESVKETTGFDLVEVMKADTLAGVTDKNITDKEN